MNYVKLSHHPVMSIRYKMRSKVFYKTEESLTLENEMTKLKKDLGISQ